MPFVITSATTAEQILKARTRGVTLHAGNYSAASDNFGITVETVKKAECDQPYTNSDLLRDLIVLRDHLNAG